MKFYILASLILFCLVIKHAIRKNRKIEKEADESFWERESRANEVRKKSIEGLDYIPIPGFVLQLLSQRETAPFPEYLEIVSSLCHSKLLNLAGISNTELKLTYGAANLPVLSEYEENFSLFIRTLDQAASLYYEEALTKEAAKDVDAKASLEAARSLWEYAVKIGSDITSSYLGLAKIYAKTEPDKLEELLLSARLLTTSKSDIIVRKLEEFGQSIC